MRDQLKRLEQERQSYGLEDVYRTAERSRATIYTVVSGYRYIGLTPEQQLAQFQKESDVTDSRILMQLSPQRRELVQGRMQDSNERDVASQHVFFDWRAGKNAECSG